jgi:hypothetical protein
MLKVITPAANKRLTTVEAVRAQLGVTQGEFNDAGVEALIDRVSAAIPAYCGRGFATEIVRQTEFPQLGLLSIPLARFPVVADSITVTENGVALTADVHFVLDEDVSTLRRIVGGFRRDWCGSVVIDYTAGYVLPEDDGERTLPADVEMAALYLIGDMYQTIKNAPNGGYAVRSLTLDGVGSITYDTPRITQASDAGSPGAALNAVAQILLAPYMAVTL